MSDWPTLRYLVTMVTAGCFVVVGDHLSVKYYGEERVLRIVSITPLDTASPPALLSPLRMELSEQLSTLTLSQETPPTVTGHTLAQDTPPTPHTSHAVYKVTLKTELVVQSRELQSVKVSHDVCCFPV